MMYKIAQGSVRDHYQVPTHREGWWWHCVDKPRDGDWGYSPEGPFLNKAHATRHLNNTLRLARVAERTGRWPRMPGNEGWVSRSGLCKRHSMKPLPRTRCFGKSWRNLVKAMCS